MLEPATLNLNPDCAEPPPLPITVNDEPEFEIPKSLTPILTTIVVPAGYGILSIGQVMRALMKKIAGYSLLNSDMLPNSSWTPTLCTQPSLALFQVFFKSHFSVEVHTFYDLKKSLIISTLL